MSVRVNNAGRIYGSMLSTGENNSPVMLQVPRFKFDFTLKMFLNNLTQPLLCERVRTVQLPDVSFDTQIANQYNVKRVVQTKMNIGTATVVFYDTLDSEFFIRVVEPYIANYYNSGQGIGFNTGDTATNTNSVINESFRTRQGFTPTNSQNRYFIPKINVYQWKPGIAGKQTDMINCMITNIQYDILDYSTSELCQFTVTFQPERVEQYVKR